MTFEQYWHRLVEKNAGLASESTKMTISVGAFHRALRQAWQSGQESNGGKSREYPDFLRDLMRGL